MKKIDKPKIKPKIENASINGVLLEDKMYDFLFENECCKRVIENIEFNGCAFKNVNFDDECIKNVDFIDCIFDSCNLSNFYTSAKLFLRCKFSNCSFIGASLFDSSIRHVIFKECNMSYVNFSSSLNSVLFYECNLSKGRFFENKFQNVIMDKCNLTDTEIYKTKLDGMDLSNCNLEGIIADINSIKGVTTDLIGASYLARLFGVNIKL